MVIVVFVVFVVVAAAVVVVVANGFGNAGDQFLGVLVDVSVCTTFGVDPGDTRTAALLFGNLVSDVAQGLGLMRSERGVLTRRAFGVIFG